MIEKKERREYARLSAYHLVKYRLLSQSKGEPIITSVKDISGGGLCLRTTENLPVSSMLQLYINFPHLSQPIVGVAQVIWTRKLKKVNTYESGLRFFNIEEALRNAIIGQIDTVHKRIAQEKGKESPDLKNRR